MKKYISIITMLLIIIVINGCKKDKEQPEILTKFPAPAWKLDQTGKYPVSMTAVVAIPEKLRAAMQSGDMMGAFINGECRGLGSIVNVNAALSVFYVLIHGTAAEQGKIRFSYYSNYTSYMYATTEFLDFTLDGNFGTPDAPEVLNLVQLK